MTVAIQRQPRFHRVLIVVGLIALVAWLAVAMTQMVEPERASGDPAPAQTSRQAGPGNVSPAIQDGYLTPQAILSAQAAREAELRLQDGYLPSAAVVRSGWGGDSSRCRTGISRPPVGLGAPKDLREPTTPRFGRQ